jgi:hypothetical protein
MNHLDASLLFDFFGDQIVDQAGMVLQELFEFGRDCPSSQGDKAIS